MTLTDEMARWAVGVYRHDGLPQQVEQAATAQRLSVFGALAGTTAVEPPTPPARVAAPVEELARTVEAAAALDFDDYLCFGHAGLSSVLVAAFTADQSAGQLSHQQVVRAQAVASELHARVAGAGLIGRHGPTQWAYSHAVSAATATGLLLGFDAPTLSQALAIALAQPAVPTRAAFFGPDTRSLSIGNAVLLGVRAAWSAADGRTGPTHVLDDDSGGLLPLLTGRPLPEMISGLGSGWSLDTLSVKTRPSCSYVDTALDALGELGPLDATRIRKIVVSAAAPTVLMTRLAQRYLPTTGLTASVAAFSVPLSLALTLQHGRLTPDEVCASALRKAEPDVTALARRITVRHDPRLTGTFVRQIAGVFPVHTALARRLPGGRRAGSGGPEFWSATALRNFRMAFPARLTVQFHDGTTARASAAVPDGAAGSTRLSAAAAAAEKFATWGERAWGAQRTTTIRTAIESAAQQSWALVRPQPV